MEISRSVLVLSVFTVMVLNSAKMCRGSVTSSFVRTADKGVDMPLDSDVFKVPSGYNAPQQVHPHNLLFLPLKFCRIY